MRTESAETIPMQNSPMMSLILLKLLLLLPIMVSMLLLLIRQRHHELSTTTKTSLFLCRTRKPNQEYQSVLWIPWILRRRTKQKLKWYQRKICPLIPNRRLLCPKRGLNLPKDVILRVQKRAQAKCRQTNAGCSKKPLQWSIILRWNLVDSWKCHPGAQIWKNYLNSSLLFLLQRILSKWRFLWLWTLWGT